VGAEAEGCVTVSAVLRSRDHDTQKKTIPLRRVRLCRQLIHLQKADLDAMPPSGGSYIQGATIPRLVALPIRIRRDKSNP
jgi:hypothetical protein